MAVLCVQLFRLGPRDGDSGSAAETVCKQRSREWAVLRALRYYGNRDACCLRELHGIWLFLGSMIFSTLAEWIAGHVIERMYHERWWDYSHMKWNLDGYICVPVSIVWGVLGAATMRWGAPGPCAGIPDAPADSGASDRVDSGGCAGDGCHGDLMYLIRQKPQDPPVGRRGFLAHRCELKA